MKLPFRLVYHDGYDPHFGDHVFPSQKYRLIKNRMMLSGFAEEDDFRKPGPATAGQLLEAHTPQWVKKLETGTLTYHDILKLEVPYSRKMVEAARLAAGGTLLAARWALHQGVGYNIGGGFHHAFAGHGEGFCAVNDVAVAARALQKEGVLKKVLIVDCDVHQGNGTASIFADDERVFTLSIHHFNNYPTEKPPSTVDIHLPDGVPDAEYLRHLGPAYETAVLGFRPEIVFFVAGTDPYFDDQLGGLSLTKEGMYLRDRMIFDVALRKHIPVVSVLAGGYAKKIDDTVDLHIQTARAAMDSMTEWARRW